MITPLTNSIRLNRFQMVLVMIISVAIFWVLWGYFLIAQVNIEKLAFNNNIQLIQRLLYTQQDFLFQPSCHAISKVQAFTKIVVEKSGIKLSSAEPSPLGQSWHYNPVSQTLTYYVRSPRYFRSLSNNKILVQFHCQAGRIYYTISPYQWCETMGFWGCGKWG